jgi:hypothetical protein
MVQLISLGVEVTVPLPVPLPVTVSAYARGAAKPAHTVRAPVIVTWQVVAVPGHSGAPNHPVKLWPAAAAAVNVTTVPFVYVALQVPDVVPPVAVQLISLGDDVTVPLPVPLAFTVSAYGGPAKPALTLRACVIVTSQVPVPLHASDHPVKLSSGYALAVNVTTVPTV